LSAKGNGIERDGLEHRARCARAIPSDSIDMNDVGLSDSIKRYTVGEWAHQRRGGAALDRKVR